MFKEPAHKGTGFLLHFTKGDQARDLLLVLHETPLEVLMQVTAVLRDISGRHPDWSVAPTSIQNADFPQPEVPGLDPNYFCFDIRHFYSGSAGSDLTVHTVLLERVIERLLSPAPATDFLPKSGIARGLRYFSRPLTEDSLLQQAKSRRWLLLEAVRRFGKTSLMLHLEDNPPQDSIVVYVSLESGTSPEYFAPALLAAALANDHLQASLPAPQPGFPPHRTALEILDQLLGSKPETEKLLSDFWTALAAIKIPVLFLLDELAIYLENVFQSQWSGKEENEGLWKEWGSSLFAALDTAPPQVHYVLAGSVHLPVYLAAREFKPEQFADLDAVTLSPVPPEEIETFLRLSLLQERIVAEEGEIDWIISKFGGWLPYFLLYFTDHLGRACRDRNKLDQPALEDCYQSLFTTPHRSLFSDLDQQPNRYQDFFESGSFFTKRLQTLLFKAASGPVSSADLQAAFHQAKEYEAAIEPQRRETLFALALDIARKDFSLEQQKDSYHLACPLLANWIISRRHEWRVN